MGGFGLWGWFVVGDDFGGGLFWKLLVSVFSTFGKTFVHALHSICNAPISSFLNFIVHLPFPVSSLLNYNFGLPSQVPTSLSQMCNLAPKTGFERRRSWEVEVGGDVVELLRCWFSHLDVKNLIIALVRFRFSSLFFSFSHPLLLERFKWEELNKEKKKMKKKMKGEEMIA